MCKRSCCCYNTSREGAGIAAVAVLAAGAIVAVKIGPIVARILHLAVEVLTIIMLTAAAALPAILLAWLTVRVFVSHDVSCDSKRKPCTTLALPRG
jgi:hypothetical protein